MRRSYERTPARADQKAFYNSAAWKRLRRAYVAEHPLCERCGDDRPTPTDHVHHKQPRDARPDLELDWDNLEALCLSCHQKTRDEDRAARDAAKKGIEPCV